MEMRILLASMHIISPPKFTLVSLLLILLFSLDSRAQKTYPQDYFGPPLEIPIYLAGNFAESRSNHFHAGIDIKTSGIEGLKVLAAADGYVARIKVSAFGYGRALYIRHPNGYTTVYGHLQKYNDAIEEFVRQQQYKRQSFEIELYPTAGQFPVKKGELVAISGNSGGSVAPHLHFEVRETGSEIPVNPLLFGFPVKDDIPPTLSKLYLYPNDDESSINGLNKRKEIDLTGGFGDYRPSVPAPIEVSGNFGVGIRLYDLLNDVPNHCGIYEIKLFQNEELAYHRKMEKVSFAQKRYINAITDFEEHERKGHWIQQCFIRPNDKLSIYPTKPGNGMLFVAPGTQDAFRFEITDTYGNLSKLAFDVRGISARPMLTSNDKSKVVKRFEYSSANRFEADDIMVYLPANVLYEDLDFEFSIDDTIRNAIAPLYHIHNLYTPLHSYMAVSIRLKDVPQHLRKFCTIVSHDKKGNMIPEGGYWKGDYLIVKTRSFGAYTVRMDSTPPNLTPVNIGPMANMSRKWSIMVRAKDNLSGVDKYNAYIDGKWVLTEFDYKKDMMIHRFESELTSGKHHYRLEVKDNLGNTSVYETDFIR